MPKVTFVAHTGQRHVVDVAAGTTLMRAAVDRGVPGIDADCGGACACATCHVYVSPDWAAAIPPPQPGEADMLECATETDSRSRLACQIVVEAALDGLVVDLPRVQA